MFLKQSTAAIIKIGFVDDTDGKTAETGLTITQADIQISKNGGAFAQTSAASPTTTHDADGWYPIPLTTTDTNTLGSFTVQVAMAGALPVWRDRIVIPANVYDAIVSGSDYLDVSAVQIEGSDATDQITAAVPSAATIADAVWNETETGHVDAGKAGEAIWTKIPVIETDTTTDIPALIATVEGKVDTVDGIVDAILVDTGTTLDGKINTIDGIVDSILVDTGTTLDAALAVVDANVDSILADTGTDGVQVVGIKAAALADLFDTDSGTTYGAAAAGSVVKEIADNAGGSSLTAADIADAVWDEASTGHVDAGKAGAQLWTDIDAILVDTGTTLQGELDGIQADTEDLQTQIGTAGAGLTAVPWNAAWDAEVQSEAEDALVANHLDHLLAAAFDPAAKPGNASSLWNTIIEDDGGVPRFTANALEQAPSGTGSNKYEVRGDLTQKATGEVQWQAWCEKNGQPEDSTNCTVAMYAIDGDGTVTAITGATDTAAADDANHVMSGEIADPGITVGVQHYLLASMTADGGTRIGIIPFKAPVRTT